MKLRVAYKVIRALNKDRPHPYKQNTMARAMARMRKSNNRNSRWLQLTSSDLRIYMDGILNRPVH